MTPKASDAAIERVSERWTKSSDVPWDRRDYNDEFYALFTAECDREQALSDALRTVHGDNIPDALAGFVLPVVVDPIVDQSLRLMQDFYLSPEYHPDAKRPADVVQAAIAFSLRAIAAQGGPA